VGTSYLLDTHAVVWLVTEFRPASASLLSDLNDPANDVLVSVVSAFEVATKVRIGTFPSGGPLVASWRQSVDQLGARELELTSGHAVTAGSLDWPHADPFDRLLVGQATVDALTLVTADRRMWNAPGVDVRRW
jgi:PIN domain nuclease of toxin-antitoxin system